jgi:hypothetical protein
VRALDALLSLAQRNDLRVDLHLDEHLDGSERRERLMVAHHRSPRLE